MRTFHKGEKDDVGVVVSRTSGGEFALESATYEVRDRSGEPVESGAATTEVTSDGVRAFFRLDSSQDKYAAEATYWVYIWVVIATLGKRLAGVVEVRIAK